MAKRPDDDPNNIYRGISEFYSPAEAAAHFDGGTLFINDDAGNRLITWQCGSPALTAPTDGSGEWLLVPVTATAARSGEPWGWAMWGQLLNGNVPIVQLGGGYASPLIGLDMTTPIVAGQSYTLSGIRVPLGLRAEYPPVPWR